MSKIQYLKPALTIQQQVAQLKSRGLIIQDEKFAEDTLSRIIID